MTKAQLASRVRETRAILDLARQTYARAELGDDAKRAAFDDAGLKYVRARNDYLVALELYFDESER